MTPLESTRSLWCLGRDQRPLGGPHHTHRMHAALGGATSGRQRLRVFVPHDFGLQTIRVTEEDTQSGAEVGNGAIRGAYVHEPGARVLEGLSLRALSPKWSRRPRPNMGVWIWAWVLPGTSKTLNALCPPRARITMRSPTWPAWWRLSCTTCASNTSW